MALAFVITSKASSKYFDLGYIKVFRPLCLKIRTIRKKVSTIMSDIRENQGKFGKVKLKSLSGPPRSGFDPSVSPIRGSGVISFDRATTFVFSWMNS